MPAVAIVGAVAAIGIAGGTVASVGLTVGAVFSIVAAVGAVAGAVGTIAKVKELQYAGAALGAVGMIGGLASMAGLFGEASSLFGGAGGLMGSGSIPGQAAQAASAAADAGGLWSGVGPALPTAGYESVGALMEGQGIVAGEIPGQFDVISMANGQGPSVQTAGAPNVTPDVMPDSQGLPGYESPTSGFDINGNRIDLPAYDQSRVTPLFDLPPPEAPKVMGAVEDPAKSLLDLAGDRNMSLIPKEGNMSPAQLDANGRIIPQGDSQGGTLGSFDNPAAPGAGFNEPAPPVNGAATNQQPGVVGVNNTPSAPNQPPGLIDLAGGAQGASAAQSPAQWAGGVAGQTTKLTPATSGWDSLYNFVTKNQTLVWGGIQAAGSFLSGAMKQIPQERADVMAAQMAQNQAAANLYNTQQELLQRRLNNMSQPMPVASRVPNGLINTVTGRV